MQLNKAKTMRSKARFERGEGHRIDLKSTVLPMFRNPDLCPHDSAKVLQRLSRVLHLQEPIFIREEASSLCPNPKYKNAYQVSCSVEEFLCSGIGSSVLEAKNSSAFRMACHLMCLVPLEQRPNLEFSANNQFDPPNNEEMELFQLLVLVLQKSSNHNKNLLKNEKDTLSSSNFHPVDGQEILQNSSNPQNAETYQSLSYKKTTISSGEGVTSPDQAQFDLKAAGRALLTLLGGSQASGVSDAFCRGGEGHFDRILAGTDDRSDKLSTSVSTSHPGSLCSSDNCYAYCSTNNHNSRSCSWNVSQIQSNSRSNNGYGSSPEQRTYSNRQNESDMSNTFNDMDYISMVKHYCDRMKLSYNYNCTPIQTGNNPIFQVVLRIHRQSIRQRSLQSEGFGRSKKLAKRMAAFNVYQKLESER